MTLANVEDFYPLSPMQQGMVFHSLYAPESGVYLEQMVCTLRGPLDLSCFEQAWRLMVDRHAVLRTSFVVGGFKEPVQVVHRQVPVPLKQMDWRGLPADEQEARLQAFLLAERRQGLRLSEPPLFRMTLMRTSEDTYQFVFSHHHALMDGWSLPILFGEFYASYQALRRGQRPPLDPVHPYRDYVAWLKRQDVAKAEAFWRGTLRGFTAPTPLVVDRVRGANSDGEGSTEEQEVLLSEKTSADLRSLARRHELTLNTLLQGAWAILLSRYSGELDVVFGATVSGRPADLPGVESCVGLFINTLPVRVQVDPQDSLLPWLRGLQVRQAELRQYEYSSLVQIQGWSEVPRHLPLFESILVFENYPTEASIRIQGEDLEIVNSWSTEQTNFPLAFVSGISEPILLNISYDGRRIDASAIKRTLGHLQTIVESMVADPHRRISAIPILTETERRQVLVEFNDTAGGLDGAPVYRLFDMQVDRAPEAVAVVFGNQRLTYRDLNLRSNRLAHHLQKLGVGPRDVLVGICVERSLDTTVGILAILKAGGAYLPLDLAYPTERLAFMMEDANVQVLLTHSEMAPSLPSYGGQLVRLDSDWENISRESADNPINRGSMEDPAYVIYTSGSTGRPKGVSVSHRSLANTFRAWNQAYQLGPTDAHLQMASFSFDVFIGDFVRALCSGGKLVLCPRESLLAPEQLYQLMHRENVNCADFVPAVLRLLVDYLKRSSQRLDFMRILVCGSDTWYVAEYEQFRALCGPHTRLINSYGLTEATIDSSFFESADLELPGDRPVPIGRPFANTRLYILDASLQPVPVGVPGELHVGGEGVARGYLNRPELTARRFIPNPFGDEPLGTNGDAAPLLYRTGDLARYLPDGNIELLGRGDSQVKIRGFRIELGEVEAVLGQHPGVREAVVLALGDSAAGKRLAAYVVPVGEGAPSNAELRGFARERMPEYMIPSVFVTLDRLPLTPNGKVDRAALPAPDWDLQGADGCYVAPRTPQEQIVADIWSQVLGQARVGIYDDFFDLGGHSLLATQIISRLRDVFQVEVPLRSLFDSPTVAGLAVALAEAINSGSSSTLPPLQPAPRDGDLPLSFAQQRLWFIDQMEPGSPFYNIPSGLRIEGPLDREALARSLDEVVRRHEALRTTFSAVDGRASQVITPDLKLTIPLTDLRALPPAERETHAMRIATEEIQRPFDLGRGPLLRARLLRLDDEEYVAILTVHHIVSDGWSMGVLIRELAVLYEAFVHHRPSPLPELPIQYADFAYWQREWLQGESFESQLSYWKLQLAGAPHLLDLPTDRPRPAVQSYEGATQQFILPESLSRSLKALSQKEGATLFMILLAAFQTLLHRYSGQDDICVGSPIAGRNHAGVEDLIGFFINTLVLRTDLSGTPTFKQLLRRVREVALNAYAHQEVPFEAIVSALQPQRDLSVSPLFQVMFVLQNVPSPDLPTEDVTLSSLDMASPTSLFDLTLFMMEAPEGLVGNVEYRTDRFDASTIARLIGHFQTLLGGIVASPDQLISSLPLLTEAERRQLVEWNDTRADYPRDLCAHQ
ncbi:MAG: amino acid adenylation domain-containing protein, partial [Chloroflexi bacterium]|nr:amino acid adenylation domain-containing protein [Chloroflexota bacterium]